MTAVAGYVEQVQSNVQHWIDRTSVGRFARALVRELDQDDVFGMAAEMAYRFLFAIFPLVLFVVTALGYVGDAIGVDDAYGRLMAQTTGVLPEQVRQVVDQYVANLLQSRSTAFLTIGIVGTLWGAAGGIGTLIKGLNRAYDVRMPRPFWKRQGLSLLVTLILPVLALLLLISAALTRDTLRSFGDAAGLGTTAVSILAVARWPILVALLFLVFTFIYHVLPNTRHRYRWSLPGSAIATAGWIGLSEAFGLYVSNFGRYDATYGSFGAAIAFLLWLYLVGVVLLIGAEVNSLLEPGQRHLWRDPRIRVDEPGT